jgi:hypothetical protein
MDTPATQEAARAAILAAAAKYVVAVAAVRVTCSFKTESGNFGDEIARCQVCGAHRGSPSAENCVNRAAAERSKPAPEAPEPDENRSSVQHSGQWSGEQDAKDAARWRHWRDYGHMINAERDAIESELLPAGEVFDSIEAAIDADMAECADAAIHTQGTEG